MNKLLQRLGPYRFPIVSLALCVLAYGLLIPWLGLYWDDWPLTWFSYKFSPQFFIDYAPYRPVSGWLYSLSFSVLHESILAWQLYALLWHWLSAVAFWWLLRLVWPKAGRELEVAALIFALYPGFSQQPIAVTYSLYFLYYTLLLCSMALMVLAQRQPKRRNLLTVVSMVLSGLLMFSSEYFYGLELLRPVLLWLVLSQIEVKANPKEKTRIVLIAWLPYLVLVIVSFGWRFVQAEGPQSLYAPTLLGHLLAQPSEIPMFILTVLGDFAESNMLVWGRLVSVWNQLSVGSVVSLAYVGIVVFSAVLATIALWPRKREKPKNLLGWQAFGVGAVALALSGLAFWIAELPMRLTFPWDRFTLPMMFGVALLAAAGWQALRVPSKSKVIGLALILGLCVGYHFWNANAYREEWQRQTSFFQQLQWRAPGIEPATALLTVELPLEHYTDNSLTAPLNWIYDPRDATEILPYYMAYLDLREDAELFSGSGTINKTYRHSEFVGDSANVLVLYYAPPGCLRILDPNYDRNFPQLPEQLKDAVGRSNLERIHTDSAAPAGAIPYWSAAPQLTWCLYFEKADLARQQGDWKQVAELGDVAFALDDAPNHPSERVPFIQGYAMIGEWNKAVRLTEEALEINPLMQPMLCDVWEQIIEQSLASTEQEQAFDEIGLILACQK